DRPGLADPDALRFDASTEHPLWQDVVDAAVSTPSRRSVSLLRAMAAILGEPDVCAAATAGADTLAARGIGEPAWRSQLVIVEPADCWSWEDVGYTVVLTTYRYGDRLHALCVLADMMMGGVAKNALVTSSAEQILGRFPGLEPVPVGCAHRRIAEAYELTYA